MSAMWSERHRPKMLSECVLEHLDDHSRKLLQDAVTASQLPNVLIVWSSRHWKVDDRADSV